MKIELETCPICETNNYQDSALGGECLSCGWYPISIPYDEEDIIIAKNKLNKDKMTDQDKLYIKTHREWVKSTELNVREHLIEVRHNQEKIDLLKLQIEVDTKRAKLSQGYLMAGEAEFNEWCKNNNIDPNLEL